MTNINKFVIPLTGILDDHFALCMACQQTLTSLLTLMASYREETEYTVLSNLITVIFIAMSCFISIQLSVWF